MSTVGSATWYDDFRHLMQQHRTRRWHVRAWWATLGVAVGLLGIAGRPSAAIHVRGYDRTWVLKKAGVIAAYATLFNGAYLMGWKELPPSRDTVLRVIAMQENSLVPPAHQADIDDAMRMIR
jgi:hypothetical protein